MSDYNQCPVTAQGNCIYCGKYLATASAICDCRMHSAVSTAPDQPTATATPRTDSTLMSRNHLPEGWPDVVAADHARTLERELSSAQTALAEAQAEVARMKESEAFWRDSDAKVRARVAELEQDKARLLSALERWMREWNLCSQEQREVGHSEMNVTAGLVCDTNAALDAARARKGAT